MQFDAYSRHFNFQNNSLHTHSYNISALSHWTAIALGPLSHNHCLHILANAFGYRSYAALNSAMKSNQTLEPLQTKEIYFSRLKKIDYSKISKLSSDVFFERYYKFIQMVSSYIVDCEVDLNKLDEPSPLKDLYLSSEQTLANTLLSDHPCFIDYAILNTLFASTYDNGLPISIVLDKRIIDRYSGSNCQFHKYDRGFYTNLDLFLSESMIHLGSGKYLVHFPINTVHELRLLTLYNDEAIIRESDSNPYDNDFNSFDYVKQFTNIQVDFYKAPKALLKTTNDSLMVFTDNESLSSVITIHENKLIEPKFITPNFIKKYFLELKTNCLTGIEINLHLVDSYIEDRLSFISEFDFNSQLISCKVHDEEFSFYFNQEIELENKNYLLHVQVNMKISIEYIIDCKGKPSIRIQALHLIDNSDEVNFNFLLSELTDPEIVNHEKILIMSAIYDVAKVLPYADQIKNMLNQSLNCHSFEIGCFYHFMKRYIEMNHMTYLN